MSETPGKWLERLIEFDNCDECGGGADDHEVCLISVTGTYFTRCKHPEAVADGRTTETCPERHRRRLTPPEWA
jgi:hypothetical protein